MRVIKGHAYGNDFLLVQADPSRPRVPNGADLARALCHRHHGIGADGLIFYSLESRRASMQLFNADGTPSELSGNGLRCLGALIARMQDAQPGETIAVETVAGLKHLELLQRHGERYTFRTAMGPPEALRETQIPVAGETVAASVLRIGNPQCVVLGPLPDDARFHRLGPALATHSMFPEGTNVEFAYVEKPDTVRILIWERGVGPTTSSGTGTSAAAVAAAAHGGARRDLTVIAPGGSQRVEWREEGVYLTGWAELVMEGEWLADLP
jgi:diaminopimelate epimerase